MVNSNLFLKQNNILYYFQPDNEVFQQACVLHTVCKWYTAHEALKLKKKNTPQKHGFNKPAELGRWIAFWLGIPYQQNTAVSEEQPESGAIDSC